MTREPIPTVPQGFPLKPRDVNGLQLFIASRIKIISVESCATGELPMQDQARLRTLVSSHRTIIDIDRYGFVWLGFTDEEMNCDFCLFPGEVSVI